MENFIDKLKEGFEGNCPCCNRFAKVYKRHIHTGIALQLIELYKKGGDKEYIHASELIAPGLTSSSDLSKGKYWDLIETKPADTDDKKSSGFWKLTQTGIDFVNMDVEIKKYVLIFDDKVIGLDGNYINISQCLGDKFSYKELMSK